MAMSGRESLTPDKGDLPLAPILNRTLPGGCSQANDGTLAWGPAGLLGWGAGSLVVVADPLTVQVVQCLAKHRAPVTQLAWGGRENETGRRLQLASGDGAGQLVVWHVGAGEATRQFGEGNQAVVALRWLGDHNLLTIHPPNHLLLWDADTGTRVWKKSYSDTLLGLDLSPWPGDTSLILRCQLGFLIHPDLGTTRPPKGEGRQLCVELLEGGAGAGRGEVGQSTQGAGQRGGTRLRRMVRSMVLGEGGPGPGQQARSIESLAAVFHPGARGQAVLAFPREVLIVDTALGAIVGQLGLDRTAPAITCMVASASRPGIFLLQESGQVSVWSQRPGLVVAGAGQATTPSPGLPTSASSVSLAGEAPLLELSYELECTSEAARLGPASHLLGLAVRPNTEDEAAFLASDGRLFLLQLQPVQPRLAVVAILAALAPAHCIKMCPPLTTKNWAGYRPLLALGTHNGLIQLVSIQTCFTWV